MRLAPAVFVSVTALASAGVGADDGLVLAGLPVGLADGLAAGVCACAPELAATMAKKAKSIVAAVPKRANGNRRDRGMVKII